LTKKSFWTDPRQLVQNSAMPLAALTFALMAPAQIAEAAGVSAVQVDDSQIIIRFDGSVEKASSFVLAGPDRIAVDIGGAEPGKGGEASAIVSTVRQGRYDAKTARIVFDLQKPTLVSSGRFSPDGRALILSLAPATFAGFQSASAGARKTYLPPEGHRAAPPRSRYNVTIPLDAPKSGIPKPRISGPAGRPLVVIDAGHGGHDPGAISPHGGQREKDATLSIARAIQRELVASGRVRVALTREDDRFLVLRERSAIAHNLGADLFISIHADSAGAGEATGATIYTLSEVASDREAAALAQRENKSDIINGVNLGGENSDIASILVDLAQRESMNASANFANLLRRESAREMGFRSDYHRMAGFAVLKTPDMPSVLIEVGYLTNANDVSRIYSATGQQSIATGIRKAVDIHFAQRSASR
jgi:N-acetylmuramoyl-L-alanine amidase